MGPHNVVHIWTEGTVTKTANLNFARALVRALVETKAEFRRTLVMFTAALTFSRVLKWIFNQNNLEDPDIELVKENMATRDSGKWVGEEVFKEHVKQTVSLLKHLYRAEATDLKKSFQGNLRKLKGKLVSAQGYANGEHVVNQSTSASSESGAVPGSGASLTRNDSGASTDCGSPGSQASPSPGSPSSGSAKRRKLSHVTDAEILALASAPENPGEIVDQMMRNVEGLQRSLEPEGTLPEGLSEHLRKVVHDLEHILARSARKPSPLHGHSYRDGDGGSGGHGSDFGCGRFGGDFADDGGNGSGGSGAGHDGDGGGSRGFRDSSRGGGRDRVTDGVGNRRRHSAAEDVVGAFVAELKDLRKEMLILPDSGSANDGGAVGDDGGNVDSGSNVDSDYYDNHDNDVHDDGGDNQSSGSPSSVRKSFEDALEELREEMLKSPNAEVNPSGVVGNDDSGKHRCVSSQHKETATTSTSASTSVGSTHDIPKEMLKLPDGGGGDDGCNVGSASKIDSGDDGDDDNEDDEDDGTGVNQSSGSSESAHRSFGDVSEELRKERPPVEKELATGRLVSEPKQTLRVEEPQALDEDFLESLFQNEPESHDVFRPTTPQMEGLDVASTLQPEVAAQPPQPEVGPWSSPVSHDVRSHTHQLGAHIRPPGAIFLTAGSEHAWGEFEQPPVHNIYNSQSNEFVALQSATFVYRLPIGVAVQDCVIEIYTEVDASSSEKLRSQDLLCQVVRLDGSHTGVTVASPRSASSSNNNKRCSSSITNCSSGKKTRQRYDIPFRECHVNTRGRHVLFSLRSQPKCKVATFRLVVRHPDGSAVPCPHPVRFMAKLRRQWLNEQHNKIKVQRIVEEHDRATQAVLEWMQGDAQLPVPKLTKPEKIGNIKAIVTDGLVPATPPNEDTKGPAERPVPCRGHRHDQSHAPVPLP